MINYILRMDGNDKFGIFPMFLLSAAMRRVKTWAAKEGKKRKTMSSNLEHFEIKTDLSY